MLNSDEKFQQLCHCFVYVDKKIELFLIISHSIFWYDAMAKIISANIYKILQDSFV